MKDLSGKVAIITGCASAEGIGFASARALAAAGAKVVITDLEQGAQALQERREELEAQGATPMACTMDVTDREAVSDAVATVVAQWQRIDIVVNNAGYAGGAGAFESISQAAWQRSWDVNVMGIVNLTQATLAALRASGRGASIINNASLAGTGAIAGMAAYTASKFAVVGLTKCLATELGPDGIRVNAVCPGMVLTDMGRSEIRFFQRAGEDLATTEKRLAEEVPLEERWAEAEEIAAAVVFLASPAASYVHGVALPVAGGLAPGL